MDSTVFREKRHFIVLIYGEEIDLVKRQQTIPNSLWEKATPANRRLSKIEEGIVP